MWPARAAYSISLLSEEAASAGLWGSGFLGQPFNGFEQIIVAAFAAPHGLDKRKCEFPVLMQVGTLPTAVCWLVQGSVCYGDSHYFQVVQPVHHIANASFVFFI